MTEETAPSPDLYVQLGVLPAEKLQECLRMQAEFRKKGVPMDLGDVMIQLGLASAIQVARIRAHEGTAKLACPQCKRRFTVADFHAQRRYKCGNCKIYLEIIVEEERPAPPPLPGPLAAVPPGGGMGAALPPAPAAPAKPRDPFEGKMFGGRYLLIRRLGKGGMGAVYLAEEQGSGRKVAVKILTEEFSRMPGIEARFKREASAGGRLEHESIVATLDVGREGPYAYLIMEYVDGGSVEDLLLKENKLTSERAVAIACDVLEGLEHAHSKGVVHRDIKPANILLTGDGRAKVIDFGLAMDAESQTILTMTGNVMGTPSFMSPEQARGERGGPLSDLYSIGIVLFLMLTGRKPFEGKGIVMILNRQINDPLPSIREANPLVSPQLEKVIQKMTAKTSDQRYKSPAEAAAALRRGLGGAETTTRPNPAAAAAAAPAAAPSGAPAGESRGWGGAWVWGVVGALAGVGLAVLYRFLR
jgi:serine/threonine-protein kinase